MSHDKVLKISAHLIFRSIRHVTTNTGTFRTTVPANHRSSTLSLEFHKTFLKCSNKQASYYIQSLTNVKLN